MQNSRPWLRVLIREHRGIVSALNAGIEAATGTYVARMDADDISLPGRIDTQRQYLDMHSEIGVVGGRVRFGGETESAAGYAHYVAWVNGLSSPEEISALRFVESPFAHPAVMFRRDLIWQHGGYRDGDFPEDYELWLRWLQEGVKMGSVADEVLIWNDPPDRLSRSDARYSVDAFYGMKLAYFTRWAKERVASWPEVIVWGSGRVTRKRVRPLTEHGVRVTAWVDIDPKKLGRAIAGVPVIAPWELPAPGKCFILSFVGARHAREEIMAWLESNGYVLEKDYLPMA
jgi:glycosyltransferase involved in cell wall biosynthesis